MVSAAVCLISFWVAAAAVWLTDKVLTWIVGRK